ncbi:hypothetical protein [Marinitenerispora sediminis]|uniref:Uncharacterized protein n=1 Tax=Marinitenerispora sediminis TaxID=1931232 RepID=A0A368T6Z2_9ACTN|nr:hypothetical protein [Marinitenerispora sediminis]RCV53457.1 hypothetical protein DEF23_17410 [Marinitenerispora sediminis]RCV59285.1 hypothetical protein DEF24_09950 [Marinitenerispora sediminis]
MTTDSPPDTYVSLDDEPWIRIHGSGTSYTYRVSQEWRELADDQRRVVLVLAYQPMPSGVDVEAWIDQLGAQGQASIALVRAVQ